MVPTISEAKHTLRKRWVDGNLSSPLAVGGSVAAVFAAELALFAQYSTTAAWLSFLTLLYCLVVPLFEPRTRPVLLAIVFLPLFRLVELGLPVTTNQPIVALAVPYLVVLPAVVLVIRTQRLRIGFDLRYFFVGLAPVVLLAVPLAVGWYALAPVEPLVSQSRRALVSAAVVMIGVVALVEELIFRGLLQTQLVDALGARGGITVASLLFGAMHTTYGSELLVMYAVFLGVCFGALYEWTDDIGLVVACHGTLNMLLFALVPLYVPGIG